MSSLRVAIGLGLAVLAAIAGQACRTSVVEGPEVLEPCAEEGMAEGCYPSGRVGSEGRGACRPGRRVCEGGFWSVCTGAVIPLKETCNGLDDDCNGTVDEGCPCSDASAPIPCYLGPPSTRNVGNCRDGLQHCDEGRWSTRCNGEVFPRAEKCTDDNSGEPGVDDNCNGIVDEGCPCSPGETFECYGGSPSTRNVGACRDGVANCGPDGLVGTSCTNEVRPSIELCDAIDNDCNGLPDDDPGLDGVLLLPDINPGDCNTMACDGSGATRSVPHPTDVPDDGNVCTAESCNGGQPTSGFAPSGTPCGNGEICNSQGQCSGCLLDSDCPSDTPCTDWACVGSACVSSDLPAGTPAPGGTPGDCRTMVCDGNGSAQSVIDDNDTPDDGRQCTSDTCDNGNPISTDVASGTSCSQGTGNYCDGNGACVECLALGQCADTDCTEYECDLTTNTCQFDEHKNFGVTCNENGGSRCDGIGNCIGCITASDCDPTACQTATCMGEECAYTNFPPTTTCGSNLACDSGGGCVGICSVPGDGLCASCMMASCCAEVMAAEGDASGTCIRETYNNGPDPWKVADACGSSGFSNAAIDLMTCLDTVCNCQVPPTF